MPKLKERPEQKQNKMFTALLKKNMELSGITEYQELAGRIGINKTTMCYKLKEPDKFTRRELRKIFCILKFSDEEKSAVM